MEENNEPKADEATQTEATTPEPTGGDNLENLGKVERAELAVKRMEEAEKRLDDKIAKLTEIQANIVLGGKSVPPSTTENKEMTNAEFAKAAMEGRLNERKK